MEFLKLDVAAVGYMLEGGTKSWAPMIHVSVREQDGDPVEKLEKSAFNVIWLNNYGLLDIAVFTEIRVAIPQFGLPGLYALRCQDLIGDGAPTLQDFNFVVKVSRKGPKPASGPALNIVQIGYTFVHFTLFKT